MNSKLIHKKLSYNLESLTKLVSSKNLNNSKDIYNNNNDHRDSNKNIFWSDSSVK